jgi:hypothetical protein
MALRHARTTLILTLLLVAAFFASSPRAERMGYAPEEFAGRRIEEVTQQELTELVFQAKYNGVMVNFLRTNSERTMLVSQTVRGANSWFTNPQFDAAGPCTILTNEDTRVLIKRMLSVDLFDKTVQCPLIGVTTGRKCAGVVDVKGYHTEKCACLHYGRHEGVARAYKLYARENQIETRREQRVQERENFVGAPDVRRDKRNDHRPG